MVKISRSQYPQIWSAYWEAFESTTSIAKRYGVTSQLIGKILKQDPEQRAVRSAAGHHTRKEADDRLAAIESWINEGYSVAEIAKNLRVSEATIAEHCEKLGLKWRSRSPQKRDLNQLVSQCEFLYKIGMPVGDIESRLGIKSGRYKEILNLSEDIDLEFRTRNWDKVKTGETKAAEALGLYQTGLNCREIDDILGDRPGCCYARLKRYYPESLRSQSDQKRATHRLEQTTVNSILMRDDGKASRHIIAQANLASKDSQGDSPLE